MKKYEYAVATTNGWKPIDPGGLGADSVRSVGILVLRVEQAKATACRGAGHIQRGGGSPRSTIPVANCCCAIIYSDLDDTRNSNPIGRGAAATVCAPARFSRDARTRQPFGY
jgi:hypothetical protein